MANVRVARSSVSEVSLVLFIVLVLVGFGIIMVFSSTMASETDYLTRHLVFVAAGLCVPAMLFSGEFILLGLAALCGAAVIVGWTANRQIGGQTGDVCWTVQILSETAGWLCLTALFTSTSV